MAQQLIQTQEQRQQQVQRLSQQQMLQVRLLEMPITELEQNVNAELDDNPALESQSPDDALNNTGDEQTAPEDESIEQTEEREERADALDEALENIGADDEMPTAFGRDNNQNADYEEIVYGDTVSFYDRLKEQMGEMELTPQQRDVMEYLIGSLDDDGYLRKSLDTITDELAIYHNIDISEQQVEDVLKLLQTFDPAGVGARTLQECLLLQIDRRQGDDASSADNRALTVLRTIIHDYFEDFIKKHWDKLRFQLQISDGLMNGIQAEIKRLNPKPGSSLGETEGRNLQQITPDFIIDTADDGTVTFSLNRGHVPDLMVSPSFSEMAAAYKNNRKGMSRQEKEALLYAKEKVDRAQGYIEAVKQRRHTLYVTMKAIVDWQRRFFQDGDEADLRPMILKDIADKTGLDISTISRVSNVKYAQTKWGTFPLRFFFSDSYTTEDGEELSTRKIKLTLKGIIDKEDKHHPLSDEALCAKMSEAGFPVARRTIAKYREQMGIPVARLRKE